MSELEAAVRSGDRVAAAAALAAYEQIADEALAGAGTDQAAIDKLLAALDRHVAVLERVASQVPAQAAESINSNIEKAINHNDAAIQRIDAGPNGNGPAGGSGAQPGAGPTAKPEATPKPAPTPQAHAEGFAARARPRTRRRRRPAERPSRRRRSRRPSRPLGPRRRRRANRAADALTPPAAPGGSGMDLLVLGAGPAYTDRPGATGASYLVRHGPTHVLLDIGQGSFTKLAATLEPSTVDLVAISHLHPDHFIDLVPLRHYLRWQFHPARHVAVVAPRGLAGRLDALHDEPGFSAAALDVADLEPGTRDVGTLRLEARKVRHTADSYAFRVSIAGDTGSPQPAASSTRATAARRWTSHRSSGPATTSSSRRPSARGPVPPGAEHLDAPAIAELAAATHPGRILLTHIQMGHDPEATAAAVRSRFDGPVLVAEPGLEVAIGG